MTNSQLLAELAHLRYSSDEEPGIRRRKRGSGFSLAHETKRSLSAAARQRVDELVIPPAWTDVWICASPDGHIQATGRDAAGRKQYIYHPEWERVRDEAKFDRMGPFAHALPKLRKHVQADLRRRGLPHERVLALAVAVLDQSLIRVGNHRYALENDSFGLTTLKRKHAEVEGDLVTLSFVQKGGLDHEVAFRDRRLAGLVSQCLELKGQRLFSYEDGGKAVSVTSDEVNAYVREGAGGEFTAKDFRTWGASSVATDFLGQVGPADGDSDEKIVIEAVDVVAEALGNTRTVARGSYIHPVIPESFATGKLGKVWTTTRSGKMMSRAERTLARLLA